MTLVHLFPGQGSQTIGMGADLFARHPDFVRTASEDLGWDLAEVCLQDPRGELTQTQFTQPALYVVGALAWLRAVETGHRLPRFLVGHSLGEYTALFAADAFSFRDGLALVKERGAAMAEARGGAMAAVLGLPPEKVAEVIAEHALTGVWLANRNAPGQAVISGEPAAVKDCHQAFLDAGAKRVVPLNVSGAFHSPLMAPARERLAAALAKTTMRTPRIPVVSNVTARFHTADVAELRARLAEQLTAPVRWDESIRFLAEQGADEFIEPGPGDVLTRLVAQILPKPAVKAA